MTCRSHCFSLSSPRDTTELARQLGAVLETGDVLLLEGPVGAGKTHFARSLIQSILKSPEDVPSPTFTLVQTYDTARGALWHADLYRLSSSHEIEELGLAEAFEEAICIVEWPDRLGELAPDHALHLTFKAGHSDDAREVVFSWNTQRWDDRVSGLQID